MTGSTPLAQFNRYFERRNRPAWAILGLCLCVMSLVWYTTHESNVNNAQQQFDLHVRDTVQAITNRLRQHEQILLGGAGLFDASDVVQRDEWHAYVRRLDLAKNYPGILGVGYSQIVNPVDLATFQNTIRAQGFPDFSIKPAGYRALYSSIIYLEPFSGRNIAAFGYDMMSEPTRARAMRKAAESGSTTISGKVKLVQETHGNVQAGFLMYVPIYRNDKPMTTSAERWKNLRGFVYSPYRVDDLMHGILGERVPELNFTIYDGDQEDDQKLMYTSLTDHPESNNKINHAQYTTQRHIMAYARTWTIRFQSRPEFEVKFNSSAGWAVLSLGGTTSILLFVLVSFLIFRRERAEELANMMTSEIRSNEERLQLSEERFDLAVRASNDGIWDWNIQTNTFYYSPRFKELLGLENSEVPADLDLFARHLHPDEQSASCAALKKYLHNNESFAVTCRLQIHTTGEWRWFRNCGIAVRDSGGIPVRMVGSILDITEHKTAERTLHESHAQLQTILDNVIDGIVTFRTDGTVQSFNRSAGKIFNITSSDIVGNNVNLLLPEPYRSRNNDYLTNHGQTEINFEAEGMRKDGTIFPMDIAVSQVSHQGRPLYIGVIRDITERKRVEQLKNEFVSTVSHELRTPLTSIRGALSLVLNKSAAQLSPKVLSMLQTADRNCDRLSLLINDILDLEKIESGRMQFEFDVINLVSIAHNALISNENYAHQHNVQLHLTSDVDEAPIRGDEHRLQQVFANLLSNAIKFSPPNSDVRVYVSQQRNVFRVSIKDNGHGISNEFRDRIFQRFAQADSSDTREKGGTGLGLSITKAIIERHGGHIDYISIEGVGTDFYFELPEYIDNGVNNKTKQPRVLLCQDNLDLSSSIADLFEQEDIISDIATTTQTAKELLSKNKYRVLLIDLALPEAKGLEFLLEIRQLQSDSLPVIIISDQTIDHVTAQNSGNLGIAGWLQKPIENQQMRQVMRQALAQAKAARILHIEDDADTIQIMQSLVEGIGEYTFTPTLSEARRRLRNGHFELVILDLTLPDGCGLDLLDEIPANTPIIVFSGQEPETVFYPGLVAALVKSKVSNFEIVDTIKKAISK